MLNHLKMLLPGLLILTLAGCATTHYGVSEDSWQVMSERERREARRQHNERRTAEANARAAREHRLAVEREADLLRLEAELEERRHHAARIYNGHAGRFGDLLRITVREGRMNVAGHHRYYRKTQFVIAAGDVKQVPIVFDDRRSVPMHVSYLNGRLWFDTDKYGYRSEKAFKLTYQDNWRKRQIFAGARSYGALALSGVTIEVEAIDLPKRYQPVVTYPQPKVVVRKTVVKNTRVVNKKTRVNQVNLNVDQTTINNSRTVNNNQRTVVNNETNIQNRTSNHVHNTTNVNNRLTNTRKAEQTTKRKKKSRKAPAEETQESSPYDAEDASDIETDDHEGHETDRPGRKVVKRGHGDKDDADDKDHSDDERERKGQLAKASREKQDQKNREKVTKKAAEGKNYSQLSLKIREGTYKLGDKEAKLKPGTYVVKPGETRKLKLKTAQGQQAVVWVRCTANALILSDDGTFAGRAVRLPWNSGWKKGKGHKVNFDQSSAWEEMKVTIVASL